MFTLRKNGSEQAESTNSDYVRELLCRSLLIMLPSSLFQADLSDCRVILEKKGSLAVLAFRVHRRGPCELCPPAVHPYKGTGCRQKEPCLIYG